MENKELAFKVCEFVKYLVEGEIQELHIYSSDYSNLVVAKDGKKISVTVNFEEEENNGN